MLLQIQSLETRRLLAGEPIAAYSYETEVIDLSDVLAADESPIVDVNVGDLNLDGLPDLIVDTELPSIDVLLGVDGGSFRLAHRHPLPNTVRQALLADLDGDSVDDVLVRDDLLLHPFLTVGSDDGSSFSLTPLSTSDATVTVQFEDLNGDDRADRVEVHDGVLHVRFGNGDGTFQQPTMYPLPDTCCDQAVAVADINSDDAPDIVTSSTGRTQGGITTLLNDGEGIFETTVYSEVADNDRWIKRLDLRDVDGDGLPELLTGEPYLDGPSSETVLWRNDNAGGFTDPQPVSDAFYLAAQPISTTIIGTQQQDRLHGWNRPGGLFLHDETLQYVARINDQPWTYGRRPMVVDLEGDGHHEIMTLVHRQLTIHRPLRNEGASVLSTSAIRFDIGPSVFADFDEDGYMDVVALEVDDFAKVKSIRYFWGTPQSGLIESNPTEVFIDLGHVASGHVAELYGKGQRDIAFAGAKRTLTIENLGNRAFATPMQAARGRVKADVNGDGAADMVRIDDKAIDLLLADGQGDWQPLRSFAFPFRSDFPTRSAYFIDDLNQDGLPDLVLGASNGNTEILVTHLQQSDGTFSESIEATTFQADVTLADVNEDGLPDVVNRTLHDGGLLLVGLGQGDGRFAAATTIPYEPLSQHDLDLRSADLATTADLDGDGWDDLITVPRLYYLDGRITVHRGKADGGFEAIGVSLSHPLDGHQNLDVQVLDVTGDGALDVIYRHLLGFVAVPGRMTEQRGDFDDDGRFALADLRLLRTNVNLFVDDTGQPAAHFDLTGDRLVNGRDIDHWIRFLHNPTICDLNDSGEVDFSDLLLFSKNFNTHDAASDFDASGTVDFADFLLLSRHFGELA